MPPHSYRGENLFENLSLPTGRGNRECALVHGGAACVSQTQYSNSYWTEDTKGRKKNTKDSAKIRAKYMQRERRGGKEEQTGIDDG